MVNCLCLRMGWSLDQVIGVILCILKPAMNKRMKHVSPSVTQPDAMRLGGEKRPNQGEDGCHAGQKGVNGV